MGIMGELPEEVAFNPDSKGSVRASWIKGWEGYEKGRPKVRGISICSYVRENLRKFSRSGV